ncbi:MAG: CRISPR-associated helicase Cas3' [Candidatus Eisenbacteria bacterium]|nr:CRISPR-associated helicase Cas3' [Candidatus Eisenbacteria bacterium]
MNDPKGFGSWFSDLTGHPTPHPWQSVLAADRICRNRIIRIPTGLGKTEGILTAWSFHRLANANDHWPRRLVWCLPMRVLVEQTEDVAREIVQNFPTEIRPSVHVIMGGEDTGEWFLHPERPAIIVGTQDMLLSRALNRGYAGKRARWPVEFGLLNHDALWVMDEAQLMEVGLATSAQLQAFRDDDQGKFLRPCYTWWMSATMQTHWLKTVDTAEHHQKWRENPCVIPMEQQKGGIWETRKHLEMIDIPAFDAAALATRVLAEHGKGNGAEEARITLVICNTVKRACQTFDALINLGPNAEIELVHSRFRPAERETWRARFLSRAACYQNANRIIVSTQVVEAGVDISASCLITEVAPWPSLVQRFGRCARYSGDGRVLVVDRGDDEVAAAPYSVQELEGAREALETLSDVGIASLESYEESLDPEAMGRLYAYSPAHLLLRREFDELFDTTPDLTGADLDISRFIRSGDERDLHIFWISLKESESPSSGRQPERRELCGVPFLDARDWLCGEETKSNRKPKLRAGMRAWVWDWIEGEWSLASRASLLPGRVVCVAASCGGYREDRGFCPDSNEIVEEVNGPPIAIQAESRLVNDADGRLDSEPLSYNVWKTIASHNSEVAHELARLVDELKLKDDLRRALVLAAHWHDYGKSHPAFQGAIVGRDRPDREDLAKAPKDAWLLPPGTYRFRDQTDSRPGFRHELAGALSLFEILEAHSPEHPALLGPWRGLLSQMGDRVQPSQVAQTPTPLMQQILDCSLEEFNLVAYLVASHHGKVRIALHAVSKDQEYRDRDGRGLPIRGIREGDLLPAIALDQAQPVLPELELTLEPAAIGLSPRTGLSWQERCIRLLDQYGPASLAFLESLLRAADVRASRLSAGDPALIQEASS